MNSAIAALGLSILPVTVEFADAQSLLPHHHRDPFDRLLAAQALVDGLVLVSADAIFDRYGVTRIW
jgi:PIN domain nuclease of toxin-antitoxin system